MAFFGEKNAAISNFSFPYEIWAESNNTGATITGLSLFDNQICTLLDSRGYNRCFWNFIISALSQRMPVLRSHRSSSMAIAVPWGPSMAINGPSMSIDEVFLTLIPSMGHRWTIDDPSMEIEIFHHKKSFGLAMFKILTKLWPFKFFIQSI